MTDQEVAMHDPEDAVVSRRTIIGAAAATAAAWSIIGAAPALAASGPGDCPAGSAFTPYVGTRFRVLHPNGTVTVLRLDQVVALPARSSGRRAVNGEAHSLFFAPVSGPALGSVTRTMTHPDLGRFVIYLGPVISKKGTRYEAVVNRQALAA